MRNPFRMLALLATIGILLCSCASAAPKPAQEAATKQSMSIAQHAGFAAFKATLRDIVKDRRENDSSTQHFYVANFTDDAQHTWMFWLETQTLWKVTLGNSDLNSWLGMRYPSGGEIIELPKSVVADRESVGSSTHLVSERWAKDKLYQTLIKGEPVAIPPAN